VTSKFAPRRDILHVDIVGKGLVIKCFSSTNAWGYGSSEVGIGEDMVRLIGGREY
jgi:hypothetical protein